MFDFFKKKKNNRRNYHGMKNSIKLMKQSVKSVWLIDRVLKLAYIFMLYSLMNYSLKVSITC